MKRTSQSLENVKRDLARAGLDGINQLVADMVRPSPAEAQVIVKYRHELMHAVVDKIRERFRICRARHKQSELNP